MRALLHLFDGMPDEQVEAMEDHIREIEQLAYMRGHHAGRLSEQKKFYRRIVRWWRS